MADNKFAAYLCAGCGLGEVLDLAAMEKVAKREGKMALIKHHDMLCSAEGVQTIRDDIQNEGVTHVMIGACSRRAKTEAFYDDDPLNASLADEYGVVISTSHHEPLMRAHVEWERHGKGAWNYETNAETLRQFWKEGMERTKGQEKVVTLAMRGDGDEAMSAETNIGLLEQIVKDQRKIIEEVTGKPAEETPQVWALYKEVQDYYDKGMRVPDDVTLLLCDDNWWRW